MHGQVRRPGASGNAADASLAKAAAAVAADDLADELAAAKAELLAVRLTQTELRQQKEERRDQTARSASEMARLTAAATAAQKEARSLEREIERLKAALAIAQRPGRSQASVAAPPSPVATGAGRGESSGQGQLGAARSSQGVTSADSLQWVLDQIDDLVCEALHRPSRSQSRSIAGGAVGGAAGSPAYPSHQGPPSAEAASLTYPASSTKRNGWAWAEQQRHDTEGRAVAAAAADVAVSAVASAVAAMTVDATASTVAPRTLPTPPSQGKGSPSHPPSLPAPPSAIAGSRDAHQVLARVQELCTRFADDPMSTLTTLETAVAPSRKARLAAKGDATDVANGPSAHYQDAVQQLKSLHEPRPSAALTTAATDGLPPFDAFRSLVDLASGKWRQMTDGASSAHGGGPSIQQ